MKIRIKRGLESNRNSIIPDIGELLYTTDENKIFIGDGTTSGGKHLTASFSNNSLSSSFSNVSNTSISSSFSTTSSFSNNSLSSLSSSYSSYSSLSLSASFATSSSFSNNSLSSSFSVSSSRAVTSSFSITSSFSNNSLTSSYALSSLSSSFSISSSFLNNFPVYPVKSKSGYRKETIVLLGDSYTNRTLGRANFASAPSLLVSGPNITQYGGYFNWGNLLLNSRFHIIADMGVSGDSLTGMLTRFLNGFTDSGDYLIPTVIPNVATLNPDWIFLFGGINDVSGGASGLTIFNRWLAIYNESKNINIDMVTATLPLLSVWTQIQKQAAVEFNERLRLFCSQNSVPCCDFANAVTDPATESIFSGYTIDNTHCTLRGTQKLGETIFAALNPIPSPVNNRLPQIMNGNLLNLNPRFVGSNTANTNGWRNFSNLTNNGGPNGTTCTTLGSGTPTGSVSKVSRTDQFFGEVLRLSGSADISTANQRLSILQDVREFSWVTSGTPNPSAGSSGNLFVNRIVTVTGRAASPPVDYLVTNFGGTLTSGADPTATWSTVLGTTFTTGTVNVRVVPAIVAGVTHLRIKAAYSNLSVAGGGTFHASIQCDLKNSAGTLLGEIDCLRYDVSEVKSLIFPSSGVLESPTVLIPATTSRYELRFVCWCDASATYTIDIETLEAFIADVQSVP